MLTMAAYLDLKTQPSKAENVQGLQDWLVTEPSTDDAQKAGKYINGLQKFNGDKSQFDSWWRSIYTSLMLKRIGHHLLVGDIPVPADNEAEIKTFTDRSLNRIFVLQATLSFATIDVHAGHASKPSNKRSTTQLSKPQLYGRSANCYAWISTSNL